MARVSEWIIHDAAQMRIREGTDLSKVENRVALIEINPQVRIRQHRIGVRTDDPIFHVKNRREEDGTPRLWSADLDWIDGPEGDQAVSRAWCDRMLVAMGYILPVAPTSQFISPVYMICNAYESGMGHGVKRDGLANEKGDLFANPDHNEAYQIGYQMGVERADTSVNASHLDFPTNRYLFKILCERHGIVQGDDIASALIKLNGKV